MKQVDKNKLIKDKIYCRILGGTRVVFKCIKYDDYDDDSKKRVFCILYSFEYMDKDKKTTPYNDTETFYTKRLSKSIYLRTEGKIYELDDKEVTLELL